MPEEKIRILAVDDEEDNLRLFRALLSKYLPEADVYTATNGEEGLHAVEEHTPDIVLLDARMPRMDGFEMCRRLKTNPVTSDIPVLMVSGAYVEPHHRLSGFEGGANGYLCKPFKTQDLVIQIKALLRNKKPRTSAFHIMIVDDSAVSQKVIVAELKKHPFVEVAVFASATSALSALKAVKPDLVFFEHNMSDMDGFAFAETLQSMPRFRDVPCVLLAEQFSEELRNEAITHHISEVFPKPFAPRALLHYISHIIASRSEGFDHEVLVVDQEQSIRGILKQDLSGMRLRVHEATETQTAQKLLEEHSIDLIILDNALPGKSGLEWCQELRNSETYQWIPILGLSADSKMSLSFIHAGADDYLSKMLIKEEIVIRTKNLLKRVHLTNQLNAALNREKELNQHKKKLLSMAAHDIRAPLVAISGFAELILGHYLDDPKAKDDTVQSIHRISRHALELLNNILDAASIESGIIELEKNDFSLDALLEERIAFANSIGRKKKIFGHFVRHAQEGSDSTIHADRQRLSQVLDNIFSNAIKFSPKDSTFDVTLSLVVEGWLLQVSDKGEGIPPDELAGIFDEFGRTSVQATGGEQSTGLGLAISKTLIELHGGTIWIESEMGQGTTVVIVIPRRT